MWHELFGYVYRYLRHAGLPHADAEDLAQEVLAAACIHLDAVQPGRLHAWVRAVARNKMADRARRARPESCVSEPPECTDSDPGPEDVAIRESERQELLATIDHLPERDRRLVTLRYLEERSVEETAHFEGMTVGATKVALLRARRRLREIIQNRGDEDE